MGNKLILFTMKFATLIALTATVTAETGVTCVSADGWAAVTDDLSAGTDKATCGEAVTAIAVLEANVGNDYCAHAITTSAVEAVAADAAADPPVEEVVAADEAQDIRKATEDTPDASPAVQNEAWAWDAGVALDALVAAEGDADSAKMIGSAIAAIATIAAVAF